VVITLSGVLPGHIILGYLHTLVQLGVLPGTAADRLMRKPNKHLRMLPPHLQLRFQRPSSHLQNITKYQNV